MRGSVRNEANGGIASMTSDVSEPGDAGRRALKHCLLIVGIYLPCACVAGWLARWHLDPDGLSYIRTAQHYANGNIGLALSGFWSPLCSWLLVPFIRCGLDPQLASRTLNVLAGAAFILGTFRLARAFGAGSAGQSTAGACAGLLALPMSWQLIGPDLLFAAIVAFYLSLTARALRGFPGRAFAAGLLGGLGYLSKAYGFPFFLLHYTFSVIYWAKRGGPDGARGLRRLIPWLMGMAGFVLVAAPWAALISLKYGRCTYSTAGRIAHALKAPGVTGHSGLPTSGLKPVPPGRFTLGEDPSALPYPYWSPFSSVAEFVHQVKVIWRNTNWLLGAIRGIDAAGLLLIIWPYAIVWALRNRGTGSLPGATVWAVVSCGGFCLGYLVLCASEGGPRYLWPIVPLGVALMASLLHAEIGPKPAAPAARPRILGDRLAAALVVLSFAYPSALSARALSKARPGVSVHHLAGQVQLLHVPGPFAANERYRGAYVAYYLGTPFVGCPEARRTADVVSELRTARAGALLVFDDVSASEQLDAEPDVKRVNPVPLTAEDGTQLNVYEVIGCGGR
jgi:hypothetical protein